MSVFSKTYANFYRIHLGFIPEIKLIRTDMRIRLRCHGLIEDHDSIGVVSGYWFSRVGAGWTRGGTGTVPARAGLKGPMLGWHCSSPRCKGIPTGDVFRPSRHITRDNLAQMELRFF
ncbi:hypothetical protein T10_3638 [Trichinella papuae]|uniref:Uncharacterized protein n=1 Tax=Trichinella papuae TaxID=268474 RepID=A0A0V1MPJ2_9BILA|nr:hypothetical protein T10_3638 [Trichinella papuae]